MSSIAAVVLTQNESDHISECLDSLSWCEERIIVDSQSTDSTREIVLEKGGRVVDAPSVAEGESFDQFRQLGIEEADTDWILVVDADERIPQGLARTLRNIVASDVADVVYLPRKNYLFGRWAKGGYWPDYNARLFKRDAVRFSPNVHSFVEILNESSEAQLPAEQDNAIVHYRYDSVSEFIEHHNRYTSVVAKEMSPTVRVYFIDPFVIFFEHFIRQGGYQQGTYGIVLAILAFLVRVLEGLKVWEIDNSDYR